ncbi:MAG: YkgJ family cysteine cluster protein [Acidobacteriota bacterium]|nr:YkgJ family cysteine cluster protein [Acidobacteriota bacterium]
MSRRLHIFYSCARCPAYCCSYARIQVSEKDIRRLARHFGTTEKKARKRFTKKDTEEKGWRVLRHHEDEHYGTACQFLDEQTRNCTVYEARPEICRDFPGTTRCGYYDFLSFERNALEDENYISTTWNEK